MTETQGWAALFFFAVAVADHFAVRGYTRIAWRWAFVAAWMLALSFVSLR